MSHRLDAAPPPPLDADGVRVSLGGRDVLSDVHLHAPAGRVTGLLGPNGSGKTTLLHTLAGLRRPDAGHVTVDGRPVAGLDARTRARRIALVEQQAATSAELTVRQVVALGRLPHRRGFLGAAGDPRGAGVVEHSLEHADLVRLADQPWGTLSGGERQRAHLARALAQEPEVLLLDEPTNHLDLGQQIRFLSLVRGLGLTVVAALHDLELATAHCDTLVVLDDGRVRASGPVDSTLGTQVLAEVYAVRGTVEAHPRLDRPHLVWDTHLEDS